MLPETRKEMERLKGETDVRLYVQSDLGKPESKSPRCMLFHCPFGHSTGSTPSLAVYDDHFYCHGCHKHGDIFQYIQYRTGMTLEDSIRTLGGNVELPKYNRSLMPKSAPKREFSMSLGEVESYHNKVNLVSPYLEQRKIPQDIVENRMIGGSRFSNKYVDLQGDQWDFSCNRVVFPYLFDDKVYSVNFRRDDLSARQNMAQVAEKRKVGDLFSLIRNDLAEKAGHGDPDKISDEKVMVACYGTRFYRPGAPVTAYGVQNLLYRRGDTLVYPKRSHAILTEGEVNQLSGEAEKYVSLAVKTTNGVDLLRLLQNVRLIYIAVDPDEAGKKYAEMIFNALNRDTTRVRFLNMTQDMNDLRKQDKLTDYLSKRPYFIDPVL